MWIPVRGASFSESMYSAYVAPTGCFFLMTLGSQGHGKIKHGCFFKTINSFLVLLTGKLEFCVRLLAAVFAE